MWDLVSSQHGVLGRAGDVRVLEGHAFIVEAAVSVGGRDLKPGINVHRFANRIPLLFEARAPSCRRATAACPSRRSFGVS